MRVTGNREELREVAAEEGVMSVVDSATVGGPVLPDGWSSRVISQLPLTSTCLQTPVTNEISPSRNYATSISPHCKRSLMIQKIVLLWTYYENEMKMKGFRCQCSKASGCNHPTRLVVLAKAVNKAPYKAARRSNDTQNRY